MDQLADTRPATERVLAVDLDGTLVRSDMLYESFWAAMAQDWRTPWIALRGLSGGKAVLKARLAAMALPDPATLPYDAAVLDEIRHWHEAGGRVALVTAADSRVALAIADHLDLFDEVHASDGLTNLKGPAKAAWLRERYGAGGYVYAGDSTADLAVWQEAGDALTVGAAPALRARVEGLHPKARHLSPPEPVLPAALRAARPHQWLKNMLIFFPMVAAHDFNLTAFAMGVLAFVSFSLVASSVYLLNDLLDIASDRAHPRKRMRPLAAGMLPLKTGMMLIPLLLLAGIGVGLFLPPVFLLVLAGYYALTVAYSLWLKRRPIIDICALASLYTMRVIAGGAAAGIGLSVWLLAFSAFLFFALAAVKRQAELVDMMQRGVDEAAGRGYRVSDLPLVTQMATASGFVAVLVLMLYLNEPEVLVLYSHPVLLWAACLAMLYWISRMVLVASRGKMDDDPTVYAARDRVSLTIVALIAALFIAAKVL
ncbi:UbiA family prenyltransferase [Pararhodobacter marinus]|uniref:UbiA family prenyltransferase n=1 Tax=Pararhodobacter marinus TaxID=2184063 RepID=UPI00351221F8